MSDNFQNYFDLSDPRQLIALNRSLKTGSLKAQYLCDEPFIFYPEDIQEAQKAGQAVFFDLIPLYEGRAMPGYNNTDWHLLKTAAYIHPNTIDLLAQSLGLDESLCRKQLFGSSEITNFRWDENFNLEKSLEARLAVLLKMQKESGIDFEAKLIDDFIWNCIPIPPANSYPFVQHSWGQSYLPYHQLLESLIRQSKVMNLRVLYHNYFIHTLNNWILAAQKPPIASLWDLVEKGETIGYLTVVPENNVSTFILDWGEVYHADESKVFLLSKQTLLRQRDANLELFELPTYRLLATYTLPEPDCTFHKKEGPLLYFLRADEQALFLFDSNAMCFVDGSAGQHIYYEYSEIAERATIYASLVDNNLTLTDLADYPLVATFEYAKRYFWAIDKESNGGVFDLETGLLVLHSTFYNYTNANAVFLIDSAGKITEIEEPDDFDIEELLNAEAEASSDADRGEESTEALVHKPFCFGLKDGQFLFYQAQMLFYKQKIVAYLLMEVDYAEYCPDTDLLYLENTSQIQILDLSSIDTEIRMLMNLRF